MQTVTETCNSLSGHTVHCTLQNVSLKTTMKLKETANYHDTIYQIVWYLHEMKLEVSTTFLKGNAHYVSTCMGGTIFPYYITNCQST